MVFCRLIGESVVAHRRSSSLGRVRAYGWIFLKQRLGRDCIVYSSKPVLLCLFHLRDFERRSSLWRRVWSARSRVMSLDAQLRTTCDGYRHEYRRRISDITARSEDCKELVMCWVERIRPPGDGTGAWVEARRREAQSDREEEKPPLA